MKNSVLHLLTTRLALVSFVLAGLFLFAPAQSNAQTGGVDDFFTAPNIPYVSSAEAITRVEGQTMSLKILLESLNPNSAEYRNALIKYGFYVAIHTDLIAGKTTKESLEGGLKVLGTPDSFDFSKTIRVQYRTEAINLLKL